MLAYYFIVCFFVSLFAMIKCSLIKAHTFYLSIALTFLLNSQIEDLRVFKLSLIRRQVFVYNLQIFLRKISLPLSLHLKLYNNNICLREIKDEELLSSCITTNNEAMVYYIHWRIVSKIIIIMWDSMRITKRLILKFWFKILIWPESKAVREEK